MSDEAKQNVTECPNCGAPGKMKVVPYDYGKSSRKMVYACHGRREACDYAAGLSEDNEALLAERKLLVSMGRAADERAERAEALLRELAVAALAVPVELGRRLDEYMEAGDE